MELLERYIKEIEEDLKIDEFNIKEASLKSPSKKHYWVAKLIQHKKNIARLEAEKEQLRRKIAQEVQYQSPVKLSAMTVEKTAEDADVIREINRKISEERLIVEFLEKTEKTFSSLTYDLKNIIEIMKLEQL